MTRGTLFRISGDVFEQFPSYIVAAVVARGFPNDVPRAQLEELVHGAVSRARATYDGLDLKSETPFAIWRSAFSDAGWSPSRYPASVEALHKRIQRGDDLPRINPAVDLANSAALYYAVPVGTHDIASFGAHPLEVRVSTPADRFVAMNGAEETVDENEIVYAIDNDVRTRRWVWRQGRNGLISHRARDVFYPIDGFADTTYDAVVAAQNYLAEICADTFDADVSTALISKDNPAL